MLRVLIVDDEAPIRQWLEYCINQIDEFTVIGSAGNGRQGLELFKKKKPDIVVTDIEMPGMDGLEMMRMMQKIYPAYMIILTSHDDFSYARQALTQGTEEYILKTEVTPDTLGNLLNKAFFKIKGYEDFAASRTEYSIQQTLLKMAMPNGESEISEQTLKRQGIMLEEGMLLCLAVWSREGKSFARVKDYLQRQPELYNLVSAQIEYEHMVILVNCQENGLEPFLERCEQRMNYLDCVMGVGTPVRFLKELPEAIKTARMRCLSYFYHQENSLVWKRPIGIWNLRHVEGKKSSFSKSLFLQDYKAAIAVKDQVLKEIKEKEPADLASVKEICAFFVTTLFYFLRDCTEEVEAEVKSASERIYKTQKIRELMQEMDRILHPLEATLLRDNSFSKPVQDAVDYIETHYNQKITLNGVASLVNFSPEYFSRLFVKDTGINFVTYVNQLRMKHAAKMLESTDKKIYEIAEETGFSNVSYFLTAFKKHFGQTPNEYRSGC